MTSIIPFFILLLTAYTFAAPIDQENSTIDYELSTGQTTVSMDLISNNLSTALPIIQQQGSVEQSNSTGVTTEYVTRPTRVYRGQPLDEKSREKLAENARAELKRKYSKRNENSDGVSPSDSNENQSNEKRDSQESLISKTTQGYKKRSDAAYQDSLEDNSNEKRESSESVLPTTTQGYKKRSDGASEDSLENNSNEKRESVYSTTQGYKKRSDAAYQDSLEDNSNEKRESVYSTTQGYKKRSDAAYQDSLEDNSNEKRESVYSTTQGYKKRSDAAYQDSLESDSNEKRESVYSTTTQGYKKRSDGASEDSLESESSEKRAVNQSVISTSTKGYKKMTPKSYLFTTLESSTTFNRRAIRPSEESQEEPESASVYPKQQMIMKSNAKPSSSVNSFGKATGLPNNESVNQSSEESQTSSPVRSQKFIQPVSFIPEQVRKTEVFPNVPSKSSATMQPSQHQQLSQGRSQSQS